MYYKEQDINCVTAAIAKRHYHFYCCIHITNADDTDNETANKAFIFEDEEVTELNSSDYDLLLSAAGAIQTGIAPFGKPERYTHDLHRSRTYSTPHTAVHIVLTTLFHHF